MVIIPSTYNLLYSPITWIISNFLLASFWPYSDQVENSASLPQTFLFMLQFFPFEVIFDFQFLSWQEENSSRNFIEQIIVDDLAAGLSPE